MRGPCVVHRRRLDVGARPAPHAGCPSTARRCARTSPSTSSVLDRSRPSPPMNGMSSGANRGTPMSTVTWPSSVEPRHDDPARRLDADLALVGEAVVAHEHDEAARTVAALLDLAAVGVEDPVAEVDVARGGALDDEHLVAADAEAPVGERANLRRRRASTRWRTPSTTTKSLPRPVHLGELERRHRARSSSFARSTSPRLANGSRAPSWTSALPVAS